jgi:hypothetical protein
MKAAQQMNGIGEVTARMATRRFEQQTKVRMASRTLACDTRKLGFGNADRVGALLADGPIDCHSSPRVLSFGQSPIELVVTQRRKDEVYGHVTFREP